MTTNDDTIDNSSKEELHSNSFGFELLGAKQKMRAGIISTPHGRVETPIFMPVGTKATVKALDSQDITETQAQIILGNTYHLYLRPGTAHLEQLGGLHHFMGWHKPILTDSGGFQVFSLGKQLGKSDKQQTAAGADISNDGVTFNSHIDGSKHIFTPQKSIEIQRSIGADIIMAFDECAPDSETKQYMQTSINRTHQWAERCVETWEKASRLSAYGSYQALFGIIQGGLFKDLREEATLCITNLPFDGIAVGGETIGYNMEGTVKVMSWIERLLPEHKPRYAMGLGRDPQDLIDAITAGFDMFDCVGPTRLARNGALYYGQVSFKKGKPTFISPYTNGRLSISKSEFAVDTAVIQEDCDCHTCTSGYTRAYLHHLYRTKELTYYRLASIHNTRFMIRLCQTVRKFIIE